VAKKAGIRFWDFASSAISFLPVFDRISVATNNKCHVCMYDTLDTL
jgi:hypothetical protein